MEDARLNRLHRKVRLLAKENEDMELQISRFGKESSDSDGEVNKHEPLVKELNEKVRVAELEKHRLDAQVEKLKGDLSEALRHIQDLKLAQAINTPAGSTFLQTTELLEATLAFLPIRRVLLAQRVCRLWRDTVAASPVLQKKVWLKQSCDAVLDSVHLKESFRRIHRKKNLCQLFGPLSARYNHVNHCHKDHPEWQLWKDVVTETDWTENITLNPWFRTNTSRKVTDDLGWGEVIYFDRQHLEPLQQGSWRDMHVSSPPVRRFEAYCMFASAQGGPMLNHLRLTPEELEGDSGVPIHPASPFLYCVNRDGVRLREVVDCLLEKAGAHDGYHKLKIKLELNRQWIETTDGVEEW